VSIQVSELFWNASLDELKRGYVFQEANESYVCLVCGKSFTKGIIYSEDQIYYEAEKFAAVHIVKEHVSMFDYLLNLNKKLTGLTDLQKTLLDYFRRGYSDAEIVKKLGGGSTSTIRHHRFTLREKEKQAKVFLALMELAQMKTEPKEQFIAVPKTATMLDERYAITEKENEDILKTYFKSGPDGPLESFPKKEKRKVAILKHIVSKFDPHKKYTEKEVNKALKAIYPDDYVTLRRYLIEYGFMDRHDDGSAYWVKHE
jgi:DNA-binding CsgD family transcriptional regulator